MDLHNLSFADDPNEVANEIHDLPLSADETKAVIGFLLRRVAYLEQRVANLTVRSSLETSGW